MATPALSLRHVSAFAADVRESLTKAGQRELPSKYLYDEVGSALFETICVLPEYGLTRADARLLEKHAGEIVSRLPSPVQVAELGSGSGKKTRWILEALSRRQKTYYYPIEISPFALAACEKELGHIDMVSIVGYEQPYLEGLRTVAEGRAEEDHLLVLFLGSTIGNFELSQLTANRIGCFAGFGNIDDDDIGHNTFRIDFHARQFGKTFCQPFRVRMIICQTLWRFFQRD